MRLAKDEPNVAVVSVAHSYGFSNLVLPLLLKGMPLIVLPDPLPGSLRRGLAAHEGRVTLPAVPAMWRAWHQAGLLRDAPVARAISAGAPMPLELEHAIHAEAGLKVHNFYGASECGGIAYDDGDLPRDSAEQVGRVMQGVNVTVDDQGCLQVASPAVATGYEHPDESLQDGVFRTSDCARLDGDRVALIGRVTDTIHVAGRKVAPQVIEAVILGEARVRCCVVFGVPSADPARVEEVVACVHATGEDRQIQTALLSRLSRELPRWQVPRRWWFTSELLPDARGKISRQQWRRRFLDHPV
jgi:acyl-CoA synthetase (AMP-forming)/AMP-acid ligase II